MLCRRILSISPSRFQPFMLLVSKANKKNDKRVRSIFYFLFGTVFLCVCALTLLASILTYAHFKTSIHFTCVWIQHNSKKVDTHKIAEHIVRICVCECIFFAKYASTDFERRCKTIRYLLTLLFKMYSIPNGTFSTYFDFFWEPPTKEGL